MPALTVSGDKNRSKTENEAAYNDLLCLFLRCLDVDNKISDSMSSARVVFGDRRFKKYLDK